MLLGFIFIILAVLFPVLVYLGGNKRGPTEIFIAYFLTWLWAPLGIYILRLIFTELFNGYTFQNAIAKIKNHFSEP